MKAAEGLLDAGIPFIAFDPVGVWKFLKVGINGNKGYPIVVAGGKGSDIILTPTNAVSIVRAAMKSNVSLIIDLFTPELANKSTWIKIVHAVLEMLIQENREYGVRHIFLEEASEFIPQRPNSPGQALVFATVERLAKLGRNSGLGFTIINQRTQEVAKSVFELCVYTLLFKQVHKNSLKSVLDWLDIREIKDAKKVVSSMSSLQSGECWAMGEDQEPIRIKILPRKTFHPSPQHHNGNIKIAQPIVDVSSFVAKLNKVLQDEVPHTDIKKPADNIVNNFNKEITALKNEIVELKKLNTSITNENNGLRNTISRIQNDVRKQLDTLKQSMRYITEVELPTQQKRGIPSAPANTTPLPPAKSKPVSVVQGYSKSMIAILQFLASYKNKSFRKIHIGIGSGYSPASSGLEKALSLLSSGGMILREDGRIRLNPEADLRSVIGDFEPVQFSIQSYLPKLPKAQQEIMQVLLDNPDGTFNKETLAERTASQYSPTSSGFEKNISILSSLEFITRLHGWIKLNDELKEV